MAISKNLVRTGLFLALCTLAAADIIPVPPSTPGGPIDPDIFVDEGSNSLPLSTNTALMPGINGFYNDTGQIVTSLTFTANLAAGLSQTDITSSFHCASGFFLGCQLTYDGTSGVLTIQFSGVDPQDGDEFTGNDDEANEEEGIPPLKSSCVATPDATGCTDVGHFVIDMPTKQWQYGTTSTADPTVQLFTQGGPTFSPVDFTVTPEPTSILLFGSSVLAAGWLRRRRSRR